jgi:hypothetical protein
MRIHWLPVAALLAVGVTGCGESKGPAVPVAPEDNETHLGTAIDIDLAAWLKLPRPELAKLADEWAGTVAHQREDARGNPDSVDLLPTLHPPLVVPVLQRAKFSAAAGFSLPPYHKEGSADTALALHLARHGDREAARRLAGDLKARLALADGGTNYPVEWSRLVGLVLHSAELKLAEGKPEGATELVLLHKQIREVLDKTTAAGPLGAALLPAGRRALTLAAAAWRDPKRNRVALANDIEAALKDWGPVPEPAPALKPGAAAADVAGLLGVAARGKAVAALAPDEVARALDLLGLPLPAAGVQSVVGFLDRRDRLTDLVLVYRTRSEQTYPEPAHLAHRLLEHGFEGRPVVKATGLLRQDYAGAGLSYQVSRVLRGNVLAALVRVSGPKGPAPAFARDGRDFGAVHLDRSFEANRVALVPEQAGPTLAVTKKADLQRMARPIGLPVPGRAVLQRETGQDLVGYLSLVWPAELNHEATARLLPRLWAAFGDAWLDGADDASGGYLTFTWEDPRTRLRLRLPFDERSPELVVEDARGPEKLAERAAAARRRDRDERQARLAAGKPLARLRRSPGDVNDLGLEGLELGQTRERAEAALPRVSTVRRLSIPDGLGLLIPSAPPPGTAFWARQVWVRFGADSRVAEVRLRYETGLPGRGPTLLKTLQAGRQGAPEAVEAEWGGLWADRPRARKPIKYRWQDDVTILTYQADAGGVEVRLRDRPAEAPDGVSLPPLKFCPRGVGAWVLGAGREEVHKASVAAPGLTGGAEVYAAPADSPYEALMVWYEKAKAARVVAVHRARPGMAAREVTGALQQAWARDLDRLGFVRRQEGKKGTVLGAYFWHDDRTRVQTFVQDTEKGPRVFTEWRPWPVAAKKPATARR